MAAWEKYNTKRQISLIHVAKNQLGISDENYRQILSGFVLANGSKATSSKELSYDQCEALIHIFKRLGFKTGRLKYEEYENRQGGFATPGQMRKIEAVWMFHSREKSIEAMNSFIRRIVGVSHLTFVKAADVSKILKAMESLK